MSHAASSAKRAVGVGDRIISHGLWSAHFPDLAPYNLHIFGVIPRTKSTEECPYQRRVKGKHLKRNFLKFLKN
jgi:hypothetical protein